MKTNLLLLFFSLLMVEANSQAPDWVWARSAYSGIAGEGLGSNIATDDSGNTFITGSYTDSIIFGSYILPGQGVYVAKYDSSGNVKWAKSIVGSGQGYGVATDHSGNCLVTGYDPLGIYLVKYDPAGNVLWSKTIYGQALGNSVATDSLGNVFITGYFYSTIYFSSLTLNSTGSADVFLAKFDSSGNILWAKSYGGSGNDYGYGVITDASGNLYVTGNFSSSSITFGSFTFITPGFFLFKADSSGLVLWAKDITGATPSRRACTDKLNNIYLTGSFSAPVTFGGHTLTSVGASDVFLVKYDSSGNVLWAKSAGGRQGDIGNEVAADKFGKVYIIGNFANDTIMFGAITLIVPISSNNTGYIAGYDSSGNALFAKALLRGGKDQNSISVSGSGSIYIGGDYEGVSILGNDTLWPTALTNVFVAKLIYQGVISANFISSDTNICTEGTNCINFYDHSSGAPTSWHWTFAGASPSTSSLQNPTNICYSNTGTYPVTLIATNSLGTDTLIVPQMIIVNAPPPPPVISVSHDTLFSSSAPAYQWYYNGNPINGAAGSFYVATQPGTYAVMITNSGCSVLSASVLASVDELNAVAGISIYPNPFDKLLTVAVKGNEECEIILFDVTSRELLHRSFVNSATINTEPFAKGVYLYELRNKNGVIGNGKVVKE